MTWQEATQSVSHGVHDFLVWGVPLGVAFGLDLLAQAPAVAGEIGPDYTKYGVLGVLAWYLFYENRHAKPRLEKHQEAVVQAIMKAHKEDRRLDREERRTENRRQRQALRKMAKAIEDNGHHLESMVRACNMGGEQTVVKVQPQEPPAQENT